MRCLPTTGSAAPISDYKSPTQGRSPAHGYSLAAEFAAKFHCSSRFLACFLVWSMAIDSPLILTLDFHGVPHRWVTWQQACFYYAKNLVAWTLGESAFTFRGGVSRATGRRSSITTHSIIAIRGKAMAMRGFSQVPPLNNRELFRRDRHICGYCGGEFSFLRLTRDHIAPMSRGGRDSWMNVVTACRHCNGIKRNRTPEESGLQLVYVPYVPNKAEYLILTNRKILSDQMEFLLQHVSSHSRVFELALAPR